VLLTERIKSSNKHGGADGQNSIEPLRWEAACLSVWPAYWPPFYKPLRRCHCGQRTL